MNADLLEIIAVTALNFDVPADMLAGRNNCDRYRLPRQIAMYVARETTDLTSTDIASAFGRSCRCVSTAVATVERERTSDPAVNAVTDRLIAAVRFRERIRETGGIDVLAVARRVSRDPQRAAIGVSVMEVAALAATVLDLWEVARAAEAMVETDDVATAEALAGAITDTLNDMREGANA